MNALYLGKDKIIKLVYLMGLFLSVLPYGLSMTPSLYLFFLRLLPFFCLISVALVIVHKVYKDASLILWALIYVYMNVVTYMNSGMTESRTNIYFFVVSSSFCAFMCQYDKDFLIRSLTYYFTALLVINTLLWRPGGTFVNSNGQASFFIGTKTTITYYQIAACIFAYVFFKVESNRRKGYLICALLISSIVIYNVLQPISTSKICLFVFLLLVTLDFVTPKLSRSVLRGAFIAALAINVLLVFFRIQYLFEHFLVDVLEEDLTLDYRTYIWDEVIFYISQKPIWGHGTRSGITFINNFNTSAHNQLLSWLFTYGIVGLFLMLALAVFILKKYSINDIRGRIVRIAYVTFAVMWISEQWMSYPIYIITTILLFNLHRYNMVDNQNFMARRIYLRGQNGK